MQPEEEQNLAHLIRDQRWAALATLDEGFPTASMVAYAVEPDFAGFLIYVSQLSRHTKALLSYPRASLALSEPDNTGQPDPQTLARVSVRGKVEPIPRGSAAFEAAKRTYVSRLPASEQFFALGDFVLFRLIPERVRYVGGFARAYNVGADHLKQISQLPSDSEAETEAET